ncbi:MAG TPA: hypothetical protein VNO20_04535 [Solirubrobacterales bacterium]|nr:hypothetical protein [Solirubrobacterales bacterium]
MLKTVALAIAPLVAVWTAAHVFAWCTSPERRGTLARRTRDLRSPPPDRGAGSGLIDLSNLAGAYALAIRVGGVVRGFSYLLLVTAALYRPSLILSLFGLAAAIWILNRWEKVATLAFYAVAHDISLAFKHAAWAYHFPHHRRGLLYNLFYNSPGRALSIIGIAFIGIAGLPFAYGSETLTSPIPGLYVQHSHLSFWQLGAVFFLAGAAMAWAGAWLERRAQRKAMREQTRIVPRRFGKRPAAVFLRPFGSEQLTVPSHPGPRRDGGFTQMLPRRKEFLENVLTWLLWADGEVLAIAQPGAREAKTVGAAHHLLQPDADWQESVRRLLEKAAAIVLVPGASTGAAWETRTVLGNPTYAHKALVVNAEPGSDPEPFLAMVGAPRSLAEELRQRQLLALAATAAPDGPRILCSSLAEDIDFEIAVEWFLRHQLLQGSSFWGRAQRLAVQLGLAKGS